MLKYICVISTLLYAADPVDIGGIFSVQQLKLLHGLYVMSYCETVKPQDGLRDEIIYHELQRLLYAKVYRVAWRLKYEQDLASSKRAKKSH